MFGPRDSAESANAFSHGPPRVTVPLSQVYFFSAMSTEARIVSQSAFMVQPSPAGS